MQKYLEYNNPNSLISPKDAYELIKNENNLVAIDIRPAEEYEMGHIVNAVNIFRPEYEAIIAGIPKMRADREKLANLLGRIGINSDTLLLLYDAKASFDSCRLWWLLAMYGHQRIKIIDGGIDGWKFDGLPLITEHNEVKEATYHFSGEESLKMLAGLADLLDTNNEQRKIILDCRSLEENSGKVIMPGAKRAGRIPNTLWLEYIVAIDVDKGMKFRPYLDLSNIYSRKGITADKLIIPYCQSGVRSALTTFVLTQLLGYEQVKNYDGSWIEWSIREELPVEVG